MKTEPQPKISQATLLLLLATTAIGVFLRVRVCGESLWLDELHTAWAAMVGDAELADRARLGNNGSLYFYCVRVVTQIFGEHEWSLRLPSVIAGGLLIPGTFFVCRFWRCATTTSLLAAALVAIDRNAFFFACEARPYALVQLFGLAHIVLFTRLLSGRKRTWTWILWVLSGIGLFHLHCTSTLVIGAEVVAYFVLRWLAYPIKVQPRYLLIGFVIIALGMLPGLGLIFSIAQRRENWSHFVKVTRNPLKMLTLYPVVLYLLVPLLLGSALPAARNLLGRVGASPEQDTELEPRETHSYLMPLLVCGFCFVLPIVVAWALTEADVVRLFFRRYLIASSVVLAPLTASLISWLARRPRDMQTVSGLVFAIAIVGALLGSDYTNRVREDWRSAAQMINNSSHEQPVVLYSGLIETDAWHDTTDAAHKAYCEFPLRGIYAVDAEREIISLPRTRSVPPILLPDTATDAWLLVRSSSPSEVKADVLRAMGEEWTIQAQQQCGRLLLCSLHRTQ